MNASVCCCRVYVSRQGAASALASKKPGPKGTKKMHQGSWLVTLHWWSQKGSLTATGDVVTDLHWWLSTGNLVQRHHVLLFLAFEFWTNGTLVFRAEVLLWSLYFPLGTTCSEKLTPLDACYSYLCGSWMFIQRLNMNWSTIVLWKPKLQSVYFESLCVPLQNADWQASWPSDAAELVLTQRFLNK